MRACTAFLKIAKVCSNFANKTEGILSNFLTFPNFSKCKALEDFLIPFLEIVHLKGCLGGIRQKSNGENLFEILDIFRHWLLSHYM